MSNGRVGIKWRILIVEDNDNIVKLLKEVAPQFVDEPDTVDILEFGNFDEAAVKLTHERFDLLILDLKDKDDGSLTDDENPSGIKIFEELRKARFVPVVFFTALAHLVRSRETSFVRVVEKTETVTKVRDEVRRIIGTGLPLLSRQIEEIQRDYMWNFISTHWKDFDQPSDQADVAYLLARRLAIALEAEAGKLASKIGGTSGSPTKAHPMAMYVVPAMGPHPLAGDIISETINGHEAYWLILTPSCDFAQTKADHVIVAKCEKLSEREELKNWFQKKDQASVDKLEKIIGDSKGDRFKFLPSAFFIPDLVVDFQQLRSLSLDSFKAFKPIATIDSPFAESILARFSRYFNRLGTPDLDKAIVINRIQANYCNLKSEPTCGVKK